MIAAWAAFRSGCGSPSSSSQVVSGNRRTRLLTDSPRPCQFLASESTAFPGVCPDALQGLAIPGLASQSPDLSPQCVQFCSRNQNDVFGVYGHVSSSPPRGLSSTNSTQHAPPDPADDSQHITGGNGLRAALRY